MIDFLKKVSGFIIGICIFFGIIFLVIFLIKGGIWLGAKVLPWLFIIMWIFFVLDVLIFLPLGIFKKTKGISAFGFLLSSYIYGLTLWLWSFLLTLSIWGTIAVYVGLFVVGVGVIPIAMLATIIKGEWVITGEIILLLILTFGSRMLGYHFAEKAEELSKKDIIKEVEGEEI
jgi:hypothetical protein